MNTTFYLFFGPQKYSNLRSIMVLIPIISEYILDNLRNLHSCKVAHMWKCQVVFLVIQHWKCQRTSLYFYLGENFSNKKVNSCNNKKCTSLIKSMQITFPICVIYSFCVYKKIVIQSGIKLNKSIYCSVRL